jgi:rfaE bifunctional protein nucleotidyltransferase chain/domain
MIDYSNHIESRLLTWNQLEKQLSLWRFKSQKIVFTNGCFDLIHQGHIDYLAKAASFGNQLIIGLNTDDSVKRLKGVERPINHQYARAKVLSALIFTSAVVLFDQDTPLELIQLIKPDILVKGGDYQLNEVVGKEFAKETRIIPLTPGFSTTQTLEKLKR